MGPKGIWLTLATPVLTGICFPVSSLASQSADPIACVNYLRDTYLQTIHPFDLTTEQGLVGFLSYLGYYVDPPDEDLYQAHQSLRATRYEGSREAKRFAEAFAQYARKLGLQVDGVGEFKVGGPYWIRLAPNTSGHWINQMMKLSDRPVEFATNRWGAEASVYDDVSGESLILLPLSSLGSPVETIAASHEMGHIRHQRRWEIIATWLDETNKPAFGVSDQYVWRHSLDEARQSLRNARRIVYALRHLAEAWPKITDSRYREILAAKYRVQYRAIEMHLANSRALIRQDRSLISDLLKPQGVETVWLRPETELNALFLDLSGSRELRIQAPQVLLGSFSPDRNQLRYLLMRVDRELESWFLLADRIQRSSEPLPRPETFVP